MPRFGIVAFSKVSVQGERKLHSSSSFFEVSEAAKGEWWALFMTSWVLLIIIALVGFIAFNTYPAILLSVLVWVIIVFLTCGIGGRELNQMMTIDSTKKEEEQAELETELDLHIVDWLTARLNCFFLWYDFCRDLVDFDDIFFLDLSRKFF